MAVGARHIGVVGMAAGMRQTGVVGMAVGIGHIGFVGFGDGVDGARWCCHPIVRQSYDCSGVETSRLWLQKKRGREEGREKLLCGRSVCGLGVMCLITTARDLACAKAIMLLKAGMKADFHCHKKLMCL